MESDSDTSDSSSSGENYVGSVFFFRGRPAQVPPESVPVENSDDDNVDNGVSVPRREVFDVQLPSRHTYLRSNLEILSGCTLYDDNSVVSLPLVTQQLGLVSLPGQTLPLIMNEIPMVAMITDVLKTDRTFGLIPSAQTMIHRFHEGEGVHHIVGALGVTAEVLEHSATNDTSVNRVFELKARCRQRFKVLEVDDRHQQPNFYGRYNSNWYTLWGKVLILPEVVLPNLLDECRSRRLNRFSTLRERRRYNATLTRWPSWVHDQYDENKLMDKIKSKMKLMCRTISKNPPGSTTPNDSVALSYWVAQNLPLVDAQRLTLLKLDCSLQRLRWELSFMNTCQSLCCQVCGAQIATADSIILVSAEGAVAAFVNILGYVHETITVSRVSNVVMVGTPTTAYSWFPGYHWTIAECETCHTHVGWRFTSAVLLPKKFFALTRTAIVTLNYDEDTPFRPAM